MRYQLGKWLRRVYKNATYGGWLTDFNFPGFMVSKQGHTCFDDQSLFRTTSHVGFKVEVDLANHKEVCYYLNGRGEKIDVSNMFDEKHYGTEITINLDTKVFTGN